MNINNYFEYIINELQENKRPRIKFNEEQWSDLCAIWASPEHKSDRHLMKIMCILEHSIPPYKYKCETLLLETLSQENLEEDTLIAALGVSQKVILDENYKNGLRVNSQFFKILSCIIKRNNKNLLEWVLRLLIESGNEAAVLLNDIENIHIKWPGPLSKQTRSINQLKKQLLKKWENLPVAP